MGAMGHSRSGQTISAPAQALQNSLMALVASSRCLRRRVRSAESRVLVLRSSRRFLAARWHLSLQNRFEARFFDCSSNITEHISHWLVTDARERNRGAISASASKLAVFGKGSCGPAEER